MSINKSILCLIFVFLTNSSLKAFDASPRCFKDLEINFFQPSIVSQALSLHHVDQSIWTPITQFLHEASKKVPDIIKKKAERMSPNPLTPKFIPEVAYQLLNETLFQIFSDVLITYNSYQDLKINGDDMRSMFEYIKDKQAHRLDPCFMIPKK